MNRELNQRTWVRPILWDIVLAVVFGALIFAILITATGGVLVSLVPAAVALVAFVLFHYLVWGRALLKLVAPARQQAEAHARQERDEAKPVDEFALVLTEPERVELIQALEQSLTEHSAASHPPPRPSGEVLRGVLDRLRGFGA